MTQEVKQNIMQVGNTWKINSDELKTRKTTQEPKKLYNIFFFWEMIDE